MQSIFIFTLANLRNFSHINVTRDTIYLFPFHRFTGKCAKTYFFYLFFDEKFGYSKKKKIALPTVNKDY